MRSTYIIIALLFCFSETTYSQGGYSSSLKDTLRTQDTIRNIVVDKDSRLDILGKKMAEYNESLAGKMRTTKGYRLAVMNSSNRNAVMRVRQQLIQMFPDQSVYIVFKSPYLKLKFGNFLQKSEAEDYRKLIVASQIVSGNIYVVPETIEIRADKLLQANLEQ